MTARILVVDDDVALAEMISIVLRGEGYVPIQAFDGKEALDLFPDAKPDLVLLDVMLPGLDGIQVCSAIREMSGVPVIMLTAKGDTTDVVRGLESGADDYLAKPFVFDELLARVKALLRRSVGMASATLELGIYQLDTAAKRVCVAGDAIELTSYEYNTLEYLMTHKDKVVSKTELTAHLYAQDYDRDSNVIEVFIRRLRKKLDPEGVRNPILTQRGLGYRFNMAGVLSQ